ncbi:unnamed protein product [Pedinophyceae sp. YPF-701]|nr:unnamed protein product [Pedinophyceae sp. YPF-701]
MVQRVPGANQGSWKDGSHSARCAMFRRSLCRRQALAAVFAAAAARSAVAAGCAGRRALHQAEAGPERRFRTSAWPSRPEDGMVLEEDIGPRSPRALQRLAAFALSVLLCSAAPGAQGAPFASPATLAEAGAAATVASEAEESMFVFLRRVDSALERGLGAAVDTARRAVPTGATAEERAQSRQRAQDLIQEVWQVIDEHFTDVRGAGFSRERWAQLRDEALSQDLIDEQAAYRAARSMMARGTKDPYTRFLAPEEFKDMRKYDISGIGLNLSTAEELASKTGTPAPEGSGPGGVFVLGTINGLAGAQAGIAQRDELLAINDVPLDGVSPFEAASLISRGGAPADAPAPGPATVRLSVRKPDGTQRTFEVERPATIPAKDPVSYKLDQPGPFAGRGAGGPRGYIKITSFNALAEKQVKEAVRALEARGAVSLVLDLTDNRGGLVNEGIEVAKLFLDDGATVVVADGRARATKEPPRAQGAPLTRLPVTVLVNERTASASEIVAGALRDNCRAVVAGNKTYGKGLIQSVYELGDGSGLVVTVGRYVTPGGTDIDRAGIRPDFRSVPDAKAAADVLRACEVPRGGAGRDV